MSKQRKNPMWLIRVARWVGSLRRLIINYRFYRALGHPPNIALDKAQNTL